MKSLILGASLVTLIVAAPALARELGTLQGSWSSEGTNALRVEFPVGELHIVEGDGSTIHATLTVRCKHHRDCEERARRIKLITEQTGSTRELRIEGYPKYGNHGVEIDLRVEVPSRLAARVEMGVGELEIRDVCGDLGVHLGVGQVSVWLPEREAYSVQLKVGVGDATLRQHGHFQEGSGFIGKHLHWYDGQGDSRVSVDLGVGDVNVHLD